MTKIKELCKLQKAYKSTLFLILNRHNFRFAGRIIKTERGWKHLTVYADILVLLNTVVDYFLLLAAGKIIRRHASLPRILAAALIGGASSLYIFVPETIFILGLVFRISVCALMTASAFGFSGIKSFLRNCGILFLVTCGYGGLMIAIWYIFKPGGMLINNSVVYFNISPAVLIGASVAAYILFVIFSHIFARSSEFAEKCEITVFADNESVTMQGIVDTGNSIEDIFGGGEVIIADKKCVKNLFGETDIGVNEALKARYRLMPCGTVSGGGTLEGFRCDNAVVSDGERTVTLDKPILAVSKTPLNDDYSAIVNPRIFTL